ncbi:MAG: hypothetical protein GY729_21840, partial [Desulfobacteraceae bacterium]|nr:hypothetical protein [Desulfobacteraceae bacterium]
EKELKEKIQITSYEIIEFYDQYKAKLKKDKQTDEKIEMSESELITQLRMKKTEGHYDDWIASLAKSYPVDINKNELRACLIGLNKGSEK